MRIQSTRIPLALCLIICCPILAGCVGLSSTPRSAIEPPPPPPLPVRKVVLFQNGVAYIERRGPFTGDQLTLHVRPSQIQDILKSITVVDFSGGRANSLALPVDVSSARALAELPKLELGQGSLGGILRALRGAKVQIRTKNDQCGGRLVGMDSLGEGGPQLSLLDEGGTIRLFPVSELSAMRIEDPTLAQGLVKGLDISLGRESWRSVELKIFLDKRDSQRDLLVAYLVEMPTWKSSYRLVLDKKEQPLLQGWAIVDNVSGADWRDVMLTLTTGSPVSFLYNLYAPRFVSRPDLTPYGRMGIAPPVALSAQATPAVTEATVSYKAERKMRRKPSIRGRSRAAMADGDIAFGAKEDEGAGVELNTDALYDSMQVQASTQKVGSLYRFELQQPMTVPNRSSTMIALINTRIPGQAIYSYNPQAGLAAASQHPFRAVRIRNEAGSVLEPGPIAIIRSGLYVGEGLIERIEKGQESYIAYALDTAVNVTYQPSGGYETAGLIKISRGVIQTRSYSIQRYLYEVSASAADGEALPMMVSLPKRSGWSFEVEGGKQASETASSRYFSMPVKPGEKTRMTVVEKYPTTNSFRISDSAAQQALVAYVSNREADPKIVDRLRPLIDKVRALADVLAEVSKLEQQRGDLQQRASEIRANLKLLKKSKNLKLKQDQQDRLMKVDRELSTLTDSLVALRDKAAQYRVELNTLVDKLEIVF